MGENCTALQNFRKKIAASANAMKKATFSSEISHEFCSKYSIFLFIQEFVKHVGFYKKEHRLLVWLLASRNLFRVRHFRLFWADIVGKKFGLKLASRKSPGRLFYVVMLGKKNLCQIAAACKVVLATTLAEQNERTRQRNETSGKRERKRGDSKEKRNRWEIDERE